MPTPTAATYDAFNRAFEFFNARLFGGALPECLITLQRKGRTYGYFKRAAFADTAGEAITDEIALNPAHFRVRDDRATISTLVHEMVHLWQAHFGRPSRNGYHNRQWADRMEAIGLMPSSTGGVDGKRTGQRVSHYIVEGGAYDTAFAELRATGFVVPWGDAGRPVDGGAKPNSKTRYTCPTCGLNAWAKPAVDVICQKCLEPLRAEDEADAAYDARQRRWEELLVIAVGVMAERGRAAARAGAAEGAAYETTSGATAAVRRPIDAH